MTTTAPFAIVVTERLMTTWTCRSARIARFPVTIVALVIAGCSGKNSNPLTPQQVTTTTSGGQQAGFELTGMVTGDDGRVISGTKVIVNFQPSSGGHFIDASTTTDSTGKYDVTFDAVQGRYLEGATALVSVGADGYESEYRWFRPTSSDRPQTLDLHPRAIRQVTAGETASVTVTPDDTPCINNVQDFPGLGPDYFCRTVRIVTTTAGQLTIEAAPVQDGQPRPELETEFVSATGESLGNPRVMTVAAGQVVKANIELLAGLPAQTFALKTTIASSGSFGR